MEKINTALLYFLFVVFSTPINIGDQILSIRTYMGRYSVEVSILIGAAAGLPLRYFLEKRYIFPFKVKS